MLESMLSKLNSIPADKVMHFACGTVLFAWCLLITTPILALALVAFAGVGKEIYDLMNDDIHTPDFWDAVATIAGGAVGFSCTYF